MIRAAALAGVRHGFLTRQGGVSNGPYASLNCGLGSRDDPANVAENRRRAVAMVAPGARLVGLYQVHGRDCVTATDPWDDADRPHADALVTATPDVALAILTADCAPVLFADAHAGVVGAAHAGWKGALAGVTDATLDAMEALGARRERIAAAVGPCIAQASYQVDATMRSRFLADDPASERFFADDADARFRFDLAGYVAARLAAAGVGRVEITGQDTYADGLRFFSYRRATHRDEGDAGRQVSLIAI